MAGRVNPFARFFMADLSFNKDREARGEELHNRTWWARYLEVDRGLFSHWLKGDRRIGPKYQGRVFQKLNRYWNDSACPAGLKQYAFTLDEYLRKVRTPVQISGVDRRKIPRVA